MGSFVSDIFQAETRRQVTESRAESKEDKRAKRGSRSQAVQEAAAISDREKEKKKRLRIGANTQINTSPTGVLGQPITGSRRLSI